MKARSAYVYATYSLNRVTKENRAAGILENFDEGKRYSRHGFRQFIDGKSPEIMPGLNSFMADPKQ